MVQCFRAFLSIEYMQILWQREIAIPPPPITHLGNQRYLPSPTNCRQLTISFANCNQLSHIGIHHTATLAFIPSPPTHFQPPNAAQIAFNGIVIKDSHELIFYRVHMFKTSMFIYLTDYVGTDTKEFEEYSVGTFDGFTHLSSLIFLSCNNNTYLFSTSRTCIFYLGKCKIFIVCM